MATDTVRPSSFMAVCPVHADRTPSLHVTWSNGPHGGVVLLYCHGCNASTEDLVDALGMSVSDLFDEPLPERERSFGRVGKSPAQRKAGQRRGRLGALPARIVALGTSPIEPSHDWVEVDRYTYVDPEDRPVQQVVRQECTAEGSKHKNFPQLFYVAGKWVSHAPAGFERVLYRAPQVRAAVRDAIEVWLVEGEKDVHTAETLGLVATTNTQGGGSFPDGLVGEFRDARVAVVLDRDGTGWARGVDVHAKLTAVGASVRLLLPAVTGVKTDLTDHIEAGFGVDQLIDVVVDEVASWAVLETARSKRGALQGAVDEARARWALAEAGVDVEDNRRFARRWVVETELRQEDLRGLAERVLGHCLQVGTEWASEALDAAQALLAEGTGAARQCHLDLGVAVPASLQQVVVQSDVSEVVPTPPAGDPGSELGWLGDKGARTTSSVFRVVNGMIVQWEPDRSRRRSDDEDDDDGGKLKTLLTTVVRVKAREYREVEADSGVEEENLLGRASGPRRRAGRLRELVAVRLEFPDDVTGELMEIRVPADQWHDHSWLEGLPGHPDYDHRRAGLDQLQRAVLAISTRVEDAVIFRSTGWREVDGRHQFVHARGAIDQHGHHDLEVSLSGRLDRYNLPDPTRDPGVLRSAWLEASFAMLHRLPGRVAAPLLGQTFRAVLGSNPWVMVLVGPPGSYKTSIAAKAMHHFGERWEQTTPASSMSGNGDTLNAFRFKLHGAKDALYWADDFAPTKSWLDAQRLLEETARLIHNSEERDRSSRDGLSLTGGTPPRATGLFTSEVMPRPGSAAERMLVVPVSRDDVTTQELFPLDEPLSRHQRALVMASYISWLADDLKAKQRRFLTVADEYADTLVAAGETVRAAAGLAHTWVGWVAVTECLASLGAISAAERSRTLTEVDAYLREAGRAAVNPDMPRTTGARVRELLAYALGQGIAYVDDVRSGDCPPWPLAARLGWRRSVLDTNEIGTPLKYRLEAKGIRLGWVLHDPRSGERGRVLMCDSTQLEAVLKAASATQTEKLEIDRSTACRALHDEGILIPDTSEGRVRHTAKCQIYAEDRTARMVVLRLDAILGDTGGPDAPDDDPESDDGDDAGPGPQPVVTLPGLGDPQPVDESDDRGHDDRSGTDHPGRTDHRSEENVMQDEFVSRAVTDCDGVVGWTEPVEGSAACVVCGNRCSVVISGTRVHFPCWEGTTAQQRAAGTPVGHPWAVGEARVSQAAIEAPASVNGPRVETGTGFRAAAAVADVAGVWLSNGEQLPLGRVEHVGDLAQLGVVLQLGTQVTRFQSAAGQVWVTAALARQLGIDTAPIEAAAEQHRDKIAREVTASSAAVVGAIEAGYSIGGRDGTGLGRWTRVWRGSGKSMWIVLLPAMTRDDANVALIRDDPAPAVLARRIGLLAEALGYPYQLSGSTTGLDLMTSLRGKDRDTVFAAHEPCQPATVPNIEVDISWCRKPTAEELEHDWVHAYDRSGSYLAGVSGLELGIGEPVHHLDGVEFQARVPGYWRIEIPEYGDWRMPHPLDPRGSSAGRIRWVTTPTLQWAREQGYEPQIMEAFTWAQHGRVLDGWYERVRDARSRLDIDDPDAQIARDQIKQIYAPTIGMMGSSIHMAGRAGYAPERRHMIIAKARTNIERRIAKIGADTGRWPLAIIADTIVYSSPDPDPVASWPGGAQWMGRELGRYKVEGSARLDSQLQYLVGGPYRGKDALVGRQQGAE
jgi:hypothetical protein